VTHHLYHTPSVESSLGIKPRTIDFESDVPAIDLSTLIKPSRFKPKLVARPASIIKRALRATVRAGFAPTGFRVGDNGEITVFTKVAERAASSSSEDVNEWDEVDGAI
jgi:hypothetical protein